MMTDKEYENEIKERYLLVSERIRRLPEEDCPSAYAPFFKEICGYISAIFDDVADGAGTDKNAGELYARQEKFFLPLSKENYEKSFLNPDIAVSAMGKETGGRLSAVYADVMSMPVWAMNGRIDLITIFSELVVELYGIISLSEVDENEPDALGDMAREISAAVYDFYYDYQEIFTGERVADMYDTKRDRILRIITESDLSDEAYLYKYGVYIGDNERRMAKYLSSLSDSEIASMAYTYTDGYAKGFEVTRRDIRKKDRVLINYPIGFERVMKAAVENFKALGLSVTAVCEGTLAVTRRGYTRAVYAPTRNRQFIYDHKDDRGYYYDKRFVERKLEILKSEYERHKDGMAGMAGPALVEVFGEEKYEPVNKASAYVFTAEQNDLSVYETSCSMQLREKYSPESETSFTIIAYPLPSIGDSFEEIFRETVAINTLDYAKYQRIQQYLIDALDKGEYAHVKGCGGNETDIVVHLRDIADPAKETKFENCVADVNIPVGEVFTSPVLSGTNGVLHVSRVYIGDLEFSDLKLTFKDGCVTDYTCSNFDNEDENKKLIFDNIMYRHDTLPLGEFAIGTNTTAYRMGHVYGILDKLPILIAEKTGPHFAVGDTCYSHAEDVVVYNPDGKEIVARDNEIVRKYRKDEPQKAYFNCHTDITIPFEELGIIEVCAADGDTVTLIENGRFVLSGTEELNEPLIRLAEE